MDYIDSSDLVFNDGKNGIYSNGFSVKSLLMKGGVSPIITFNTEQNGGNNVSDIFNDLVVPNWTLYHPSKMIGGRHYKSTADNEIDNSDSDSDSDSEDDAIDDNLHDKLLDMVKHQEIVKKNNKKHTKKERTKKNNGTKKTKRH
jgi:hypothetical protein